MEALLQTSEPAPFEAVNENGRSACVLICEHASNAMPRSLGTLGLSERELRSHVAWDIGAAGMARILSGLLDAPLLMQRYSRLAYDCNRPPESADAIAPLSELTPIPGNMNLSPDERLARIREICRPFHHGVADFLDRRAANGQKSIIVSLHSFTPVYKGRERTVELGILHDRDARLASLLIKSFPDVDARLNQPYGPKDGVLHLLNLHAAPRRLRHAMIEVRNDLVATERGQEEWARRFLAPLMEASR